MKDTASLDAHANSVLGVAFSSDGKNFATASADNTVKLWQAATLVVGCRWAAGLEW